MYLCLIIHTHMLHLYLWIFRFNRTGTQTHLILLTVSTIKMLIGPYTVSFLHRPRRKAEDAYHSNPRVNARLGSSASTYYENGDRDQGRTMPNPNQLNFVPMSAPGPYFSQVPIS